MTEHFYISRSFPKTMGFLFRLGIYLVTQAVLWWGLFFFFFIVPQMTTRPEERYFCTNPSVYNSFWEGKPCALTADFYIVYVYVLPLYALSSLLIYWARGKYMRPPAYTYLFRISFIWGLYFLSMFNLNPVFLLKALAGTFLALSPLIFFDFSVFLFVRHRKPNS